jgi:hypothetical protein
LDVRIRQYGLIDHHCRGGARRDQPANWRALDAHYDATGVIQIAQIDGHMASADRSGAELKAAAIAG